MKFVGVQIGVDVMDIWLCGLEWFNVVWVKYDLVQFYDVDYYDLIVDLLGMVVDIYWYFGLMLFDEV